MKMTANIGFRIRVLQTFLDLHDPEAFLLDPDNIYLILIVLNDPDNFT